MGGIGVGVVIVSSANIVYFICKLNIRKVRKKGVNTNIREGTALALPWISFRCVSIAKFICKLNVSISKVREPRKKCTNCIGVGSSRLLVLFRKHTLFFS